VRKSTDHKKPAERTRRAVLGDSPPASSARRPVYTAAMSTVPRRSSPPLHPMTLGNMRALGVRSLAVSDLRTLPL
jgi:hypothetical protein